MGPEDELRGGRCVGRPELTSRFYSENTAEVAEMLRFCEPCMIRKKCLKVALDRDEWGVWGGTTRKQRVDIRAGRVPRSFYERPKP